MINHKIIYRQEIKPTDIDAISNIVRSSGFFSTPEIDIAVELAEEKLELGNESTYRFLFAEKEKEVIGYTCYGFIFATAGSFDLYWIAVHEKFRGQGLGESLLTETENLIRTAGGRLIYADTSSRDQYKPTHFFYEKCGYRREALLKDFYAPGDSKIIYVKNL